MKYLNPAVLIFLLAGCVSAKTTGFVDPDYRDRGYEVSKVVVQINGATMEETQLAEQKLSEKFNTHSVTAIKFTDIVPPTRDYSPEQVADLIRKTGADSLFSISISKDTVESYVPVTYHPGITTSEVNTYGNHSYVSTYTTPGYTSGGYSTSSPIMASLSSLTDLKESREVWRAEGQASGGGWSGSAFPDLLIRIGTDAINDLAEKGILPVTEVKEDVFTSKNTLNR